MTDGGIEVEMDEFKAYTGCSDAGAPVCISFYGDVCQGSTEQWAQQLPKTLNLLKIVFLLYRKAFSKGKVNTV